MDKIIEAGALRHPPPLILPKENREPLIHCLPMVMWGISKAVASASPPDLSSSSRNTRCEQVQCGSMIYHRLSSARVQEHRYALVGRHPGKKAMKRVKELGIPCVESIYMANYLCSRKPPSLVRSCSLHPVVQARELAHAFALNRRIISSEGVNDEIRGHSLNSANTHVMNLCYITCIGVTIQNSSLLRWQSYGLIDRIITNASAVNIERHSSNAQHPPHVVRQGSVQNASGGGLVMRLQLATPRPVPNVRS